MENIWRDHFSCVAKNLRPSPIRELLNVVKQPGMISLAGGMPAPEVFPIDEFYEGVGILKKEGKELLQYGTTEGDPRLRAFIAHWLKDSLGREVGMDEIILTTGSQQVLDLLAWAMLDPGDVIITEDPTYLSAISVFENHGAAFETVPVDADGMVVEKIPEAIERAQKSGRKVKLIYTIVNFQNPAGTTMSLARRKELVAISEKYGVPVLEDDPYGYIRYDGEHLPSVFSFAPKGNVLYTSTFSKIVSPGTRTGWVIGDKAIIRQMAVFKQFADLCSSPMTQALLYEYCNKGHLVRHIPKIIDNYRVKRDAMEEGLKKHLAPRGVQWVKPEGGFFYWVDFGAIDSVELVKRALEKKVAFLPAEPFCVNPSIARRYGRLNFTYSSPEILEEGIRRLGEAVDEMRK